MNLESNMTQRESPNNALIISDDFENGRAWAYSLSMRGFHVRVIGVGLALDERYSVDDQTVVIVDENDAIAELSKVCRHIRTAFTGPLMVFTYARDERLHLQLYKDEVDECVCKPIGTSLFLAKVAAWLRRSNSNTIPSPNRGGEDPGSGSVRPMLTTPGHKRVSLLVTEGWLRDALVRTPGERPPSEPLNDPLLKH